MRNKETSPYLGYSVDRAAAISLQSVLDLDRAVAMADDDALTILQRIKGSGRVTVADLSAQLGTPKEWLAFSRLQRARLVDDGGTQFIVSGRGLRALAALPSSSE